MVVKNMERENEIKHLKKRLREIHEQKQVLMKKEEIKLGRQKQLKEEEAILVKEIKEIQELLAMRLES